MMHLIKKMDDTLALIEKSAIIICFALLVACVLIGILSRNVLHLPLHRLFESAPNLVLWITLLGASQALKQQRHIRLELFLRYCSNRFRHWAARLVNFFGAMVMAVLLVSSVEFVNNEIAMFGRWGVMAIIFPIFFMSTGFRYLAAAFFPAIPSISKQVNLRSTPNR
jgi:TRAP-type C4-dicarboxylate transport system permease small subunit